AAPNALSLGLALEPMLTPLGILTSSSALTSMVSAALPTMLPDTTLTVIGMPVAGTVSEAVVIVSVALIGPVIIAPGGGKAPATPCGSPSTVNMVMPPKPL